MNESDTRREQRNAIERELQARLANGHAESANALQNVALLCLKCRGISDGDSRFCTHCGEPFNALVVASRPASREQAR